MHVLAAHSAFCFFAFLIFILCLLHHFTYNFLKFAITNSRTIQINTSKHEQTREKQTTSSEREHMDIDVDVDPAIDPALLSELLNFVVETKAALDDHRLPRPLVLVGPAASGKSVILTVLQRILKLHLNAKDGAGADADAGVEADVVWNNDFEREGIFKVWTSRCGLVATCYCECTVSTFLCCSSHSTTRCWS
jgi:hypothetical protein